jgi:hypothetical protein
MKGVNPNANETTSRASIAETRRRHAPMPCHARAAHQARRSPSYGLLDLTVDGWQEFWEDSPEVWPQRWASN